MKIMSINAGSSSLKFSLFNMDNEEVIASGLFERIGIDQSAYTIKYNGEKIKQEIELPDHSVAVSILLDKLVELGIIKSLDEINGVGHRIVSGGDKYSESILVTDKVVQDIIELKDYAPLHNPAHVLGINAFKKALPGVPMSVVFDTAFHQTMEPVSYLYPVPYSWYEDYKVRKYGAHGTSHRYVSGRVAELVGKPVEELKTIVCHLGQGASLCAVNGGKSVDTSMGFTPLAGIAMGTRSGDLDPSIVTFLMKNEGLTADEVEKILNKESGLLGMSEVSGDNRDIWDSIKANDEHAKNCKIAIESYTYIIAQYIAK